MRVNEVNVGGTINVLKGARKADVGRIVFASSCAVYGEAPALPVREESPLAPWTPYAASKCEDRFLMIKENMFARKGRLPDIGANLGYFCHRFEDEGFQCYAVEDSPTELFLLQKLQRAENRKFKIVAKSIFEWPQVGKIHFDVVLALNVFHHAQDQDGLLQARHSAAKSSDGRNVL